jgi:PAS domain S-box-containing protein
VVTDTQTEQSLRAENAELRARLEEAEETLRAIRGGEVDALVVGEQIYMLESADAASNRFRGEVLAQVSDVVIAVDNDNRITYLNPAAERQYGFEAAEVLGRNLDEVLQYRWLRPDDEAAARKALGETGVWRGGNVHVKRGGEEIHVESTVNVMRDGGGAVVGLMAVIRDITERKRREASAAFLAEIADAMSRLSTVDEIMETVGAKIGAHLKVKSCLFVDVDDPRGEVTVFDAWNTADAPSLRRQTLRLSDFIDEEFSRANRAGEVAAVRDTRTDPRGEGKDYTALGIGAFVTVPFHRNGVWTNYLAVTDSQSRDWREDEIELFRELSNRIFPRLERARAEERLRESERRLQKAIEIETVGVIFFDTAGEFTGANEAFARMSGFGREEMSSGEITLEDLTPPEWMGRSREAVAELKATGRTTPYEKEYFRKDGSRFWGLFAASMIGETEAVEYVVDVSERKQAEEALRQAHDLLERRVEERTRDLRETTAKLRDEVKERAAAEARVRELLRRLVTVQEGERRRIARELHDTLGQQLAALRLSIEMIKAESEGRARLSEHIARTQGIFDGLNSDVDFLAWELRPAALDMLGLDAALRDFVREWSDHFRVEADYHGSLPEGARLTPEVETNLYRILQEALQNVHKHAGATRVSVQLERRDGQVVLIVEDNGKGYDADAEEAAGTNKGMGVTNMGERAALVGGELEVESAPGAGATIYVRVPLGGADGVGGGV